MLNQIGEYIILANGSAWHSGVMVLLAIGSIGFAVMLARLGYLSRHLRDYVEVFPRHDGVAIYQSDGISRASLYLQVMNLSPHFRVSIEPVRVRLGDAVVCQTDSSINLEASSIISVCLESHLTEEQKTWLQAKRHDQGVTYNGTLKYRAVRREFEKGFTFSNVKVT